MRMAYRDASQTVERDWMQFLVKKRKPVVEFFFGPSTFKERARAPITHAHLFIIYGRDASADRR